MVTSPRGTFIGAAAEGACGELRITAGLLLPIHLTSLTMKTVTDPVTLANDLRPTLLKLARHLRREVMDLGVTGSQVTLLVQIAHHPEITIGELAALEGVSAPRMSKAIQDLLLAGLVYRHRGMDRRCVHVDVTPKGKDVLKAVRRRRTAFLASRLKELEPAELEALEAAAGPLKKLLEVGE